MSSQTTPLGLVKKYLGQPLIYHRLKVCSGQGPSLVRSMPGSQPISVKSVKFKIYLQEDRCHFCGSECIEYIDEQDDSNDIPNQEQEGNQSLFFLRFVTYARFFQFHITIFYAFQVHSLFKKAVVCSSSFPLR